MPPRKRTAPSELISRQSSFNAGVTLFELPPESPRRSKRIKLEDETSTVKVEDVSLEPVASGSKTSTRVAKAKTKAKVVKREGELEVEVVKVKKVVKTAASPSSSPRKAKPITQSLTVPHPAPARWREAYDAIARMREHLAAPVDTMGCDQAQFKETDPKNRRFATLVSLMLSSQTKDEVTDAAVSNLREALGGSLSVQAVLDASEDDISGAIAKVGFWRRKTQYIKQTAQKLHDEFHSDVPKTVDELCSLPGVGPKMAFLCLQVAWNLNVGIGVDVHVHRITNRLGWHKPPTKTPEQTRLNLQSWLPKKLHADINHMLVGFGQVLCRPVGPRCNDCDLSDGLCPSANTGVNAKVKRQKVTTVLSDEPSTENAGPKIEISIEQDEIKLET